jgi:uncharacterized protein YcfJ
VTALEKLARRVGSAETLTRCCCSSRDAAAAEAACSDCEAIETESARIYADIAAASPCSETARTARELADSISRSACQCRDRMAEFRARAKRTAGQAVAP